LQSHEDGNLDIKPARDYSHILCLFPRHTLVFETWVMAEMDMKRMGTWETKVLRIHRLVVEQGIWQIRTNQELGGAT